MEIKGDGRTFKMAQIEVKRAPDGRPLARRTDGKPLTPVEREEARRKIEEEDPVVTQDIMMEEFRRLQHGVIKAELKDFDYRGCERMNGTFTRPSKRKRPSLR